MSCMSSTRSVPGQSSRTRNENVSSEAILPMQRVTLTQRDAAQLLCHCSTIDKNISGTQQHSRGA